MSEARPPETSQEISGPEIVKLIEKLLDDERSARASAQTRGLAVITTAGTLVTLLLAFAALATRRQAVFALPSGLKVPVVLASVLLVVSAIIGLAANAPLRKTVELDVSNLEKALSLDCWDAAPRDVIRGIAHDQAEVLVDARRLNAFRARMLISAIALEIAGIACTAWAVIALVAAA
ncbi:hypothetical protein ABZ419_12240 [Streptomyces cinnamoneus]|uniref:hypothetical protein n=1 Tax=Streptomyces cinnamoneus TaxID=53446 RepID=UPI0033E3B214